MNYQPSKEWLTIDEADNMRKPCEPVNFPLTENIENLIKKMLIYVDESYAGNAEKYGIVPGIGIAANQLGITKQLFYIHLDDEMNQEHKYLLINPKLVSEAAQKAYLSFGEGCLSVPNSRDGYVIRSSRIIMRGYDYFQKKEISIIGSGILGMCLQHEYDHLQGKLYYDRINPLKPFHAQDEWIKLGETSRQKKK